MKTPLQWLNENSQSGPFDSISWDEALELIAHIQFDAIDTKPAPNAGIVQDHIHRWISPDDGGTHCSICGVQPPIDSGIAQNTPREPELLPSGKIGWMTDFGELQMMPQPMKAIPPTQQDARMGVTMPFSDVPPLACFTVPDYQPLKWVKLQDGNCRMRSIDGHLYPLGLRFGEHLPCVILETLSESDVAGMHPITPEKSQRQGVSGPEKCICLFHRLPSHSLACPVCGEEWKDL